MFKISSVRVIVRERIYVSLAQLRKLPDVKEVRVSNEFLLATLTLCQVLLITLSYVSIF